MESPDVKTWLVACSKGGVGKTTLATHLAAVSALAGRRTVLVDADPQGSATRWCERRADLDSAVLPVDGTRKAWAKRVPEDADRVIIDAPAGAMEADLAPFLDAADAVVVPVLPSVRSNLTVRSLLAMSTFLIRPLSTSRTNCE